MICKICLRAMMVFSLIGNFLYASDRMTPPPVFVDRKAELGNPQTFFPAGVASNDDRDLSELRDDNFLDEISVRNIIAKIGMDLAQKLSSLSDDFDRKDLLRALVEIMIEGSDSASRAFKVLEGNSEAMAYTMGYVQVCIGKLEQNQNKIPDMIDLMHVIQQRI